MSNDSTVLTASDSMKTYKDENGSRTIEVDLKRSPNAANTQDVAVADETKDVLGDRSSKREEQKLKLKRLRCGEFDVDEASKYFESSDFIKMGQDVSIGAGVCRIEADGSLSGSDNDEDGSDRDSDISTATGHNPDGSGHPRMRTGSYDLLYAEPGHLENDYGDVSVEIDEGDSEFDSSQECSSISVSDSENYVSADEHNGRFQDDDSKELWPESRDHHYQEKEKECGNGSIEASSVELSFSKKSGKVSYDSYISEHENTDSVSAISNDCHNHESEICDDIDAQEVHFLPSALHQKTLSDQDSEREIDSTVSNAQVGNYSSEAQIRDTEFCTEAIDTGAPVEMELPRDNGKAAASEDAVQDGGYPDCNHSGDEINEINGEKMDPHGLIRKPAMRRKGYSWTSKTLPRRGRNDADKYQRAQGDLSYPASSTPALPYDVITCPSGGEMSENTTLGLDKRVLRSPDEKDSRNSISWEDFFGSSLEITPSLLSLYDDRISSEPGDRYGDPRADAEIATKTRSLPATVGEDTVDGFRFRDGGFPAQRLLQGRSVSVMDTESNVHMVTHVPSENKKRPLSISSVSSTSMTSSPRLRKKRASAVTGSSAETVFERGQDYIVDGDHNPEGVQTSRNSMDSACESEDRNRDIYLDIMSATSSETASLKDATDSTTEYSVVPPRTGALHSADFRTPTQEGDKLSSHDITAPPSDLILTSRTPSKNEKTGVSLESESALSDPESRAASSYAESEATSGSDTLRRSSSSASRHEARMRFFNNYEEHMRQPFTDSLTEENVNIPSEFHTRGSSSPSPSSSAASTSIEASLSHSSKKDKESVPEDRRDRSHQVARSSERSSRRSDRRGSATKHEGFSSSSRSGFSRSSKKRDLQASSETGNRSSQLYVSRVVTEIIESERTYIASLDDIIHGYLEPMEKILTYNEAKKDIECLFSNIRDIYKFGRSFLADLETAGTDCVKVAQCFVKRNKSFVDSYTDYCTDYPRAVEVLTRFMQHPQLSEFCKERQLALGHGLPLGAYLLKPVQRILKYHLLLQNLVKKYEKEKEGAEIIEQAFNHMTKIAHHINEMKRKHEHAVRIQEIQSQLEDYVGEDLTRLGELVLEDTFRVYGAKASRQVFLFERGFLISKKKAGGMLSCKAFIPCSNLMLVEVIPNEPLSFHIIPFDNPRTQYTLQAHNMEQKKRWCQDIKQLILESFKGRIPDSVKDLIMQLGRDHDDDYVSKEALDAGRKNQHMAPEYLEKRRIRGKSGSRMPDFSLLKPQKAKRGGNKKNNVKAREKTSPERPQRATSKSPDGRHRIFSKQNSDTKNQSQNSSSPTAPGYDSSKIHDNERSVPESKNSTTPAAARDAEYPSPTSPDSPVYRKPQKFTKNRNEEEMGETEKSEENKRPASFLMARANPILSDDINELLTRCGGSIKMPRHTLLTEGENETVHSSLTGMHDFNEQNLSDNIDVQSTSESVESNSKIDGTSWSKKSKSENNEMECAESNSAHTSPKHSSTLSRTENSAINNLDQNLGEAVAAGFSSADFQTLNESSNNEHEESAVLSNAEDVSTSKGIENLYEISEWLVGRHDNHKTDKNSGIKDVATDSSEKEVESSKKERQVVALHDTYSKKAAENVLEKKSLRLPNTSKHLSPQEQGSGSHTHGVKAKLTNWNSVDKLTKGSMDDLSHLDEDPWIVNPEVTHSELDKDSKPSLADFSRPRGHSDVTEMIQVSKNKENMDWIVYLNRNSPTSFGDQSLVHKKKESSSVLDKSSQAWEDSDIRNNIPSASYATPPRRYMTSESMRKLAYAMNNDKIGSSYQDLRRKDTSGNFATKTVTVNAFGASPIAKSLSFNSSNLLRSNSTQISDIQRNTTVKTFSKERPASLDADKLTAESNRMIAEMNEYISNSSENVKSINKFPTSPPTIKIEDVVGSNRLSVISSISTSSYESQGSSSSDGLFGTLKSKLHAWTKQPRSRNDSEYSCASTLTSDDEDREENTQSKSGNTFEHPSKSRNTWKEERELETVLREHSLGSSKLGSRMAQSLTQPTDQVIHHHCSDSSVSLPDRQSTSVVSSMSKMPEELASSTVEFPDYTKSPPHSSTLEKNLLLAAIDSEIQKSDSGFSLQSDDSVMSDMAQKKCETMSEAVLELSEGSSSETAAKSEPKINRTETVGDSSNSRKSHSSESSVSNDSCYERKLSVALDSDVFQEHSEVDAPKGHSIVETVLTRRSIREYVQDLEKKFRENSPKVFEVKRKEPGVMIRQRLETLRESALYGWRNSGLGYSRPLSEASHLYRKPFTTKKDVPSGSSMKSAYLKSSGSCDSLSKSVENLSRSRDNVFLSRSRDSLNSFSDIPGNKHSIPAFSIKSNNPGHEKDANRFNYKASEHSQTTVGNQFMHRASSSSQQSLVESEMQHSSANETISLRSSKSNLRDEPSKEVDNLVVMKGWVRSLISKFQVK